MEKIIAWLNNNPRTTGELEYEMLEFGINFYHLISLVWNKTTRKHTDDFLIYKTREMIEILLSNVNKGSEKEFIDRVKSAMESIKNIADEDLLSLIGADVLGTVDNEGFRVSVEFKIAMVLKFLIDKGISEEQIFEKYQN